MNEHRLTATDILALKRARGFFLRINTTGLRGAAIIQCSAHVPATQNGPFRAEAQEMTYDITVDTDTTTIGVFNAMYGGEQGNWQAVAALARVGDRVILRARRNNNQYLDDANLNHDECLLTLVRPRTDATPLSRRSGKTILRELVVAWSCCPENGARAIRGDVQVAS